MEKKYSSIGKKYNGEKAIISLTSWKARIDTVSKTLYSLIKMCPGFHIVLCLSEEEFPKKEKELPENLMLFVKNDLIEILWVYKNYKAFKKVLFTMDKYRDVPVISADDDCLYMCNYAEELYQKWHNEKTKNCIIRWNPNTRSINAKRCAGTQGPCTIYSHENSIHFYKLTIESLSENDIKQSLDDEFSVKTIKNNNIRLFDLDKYTRPYMFHVSNGALHPEQKTSPSWKNNFLK